MKKIVLLLISLILAIGCISQEQNAAENETSEAITATASAAPSAGLNTAEPTKNLEVYNPETGENEPSQANSTVVGSAAASGGNAFLAAACIEAAGDYPGWTEPSTDIIVFENLDKKFTFRNSPEDLSVGLTSPVEKSASLSDMDFIGSSEVSFVAVQEGKWLLGLFKINGMDAPDKSIIYEKTESVSFMDVSPISKQEFVLFYAKENKAFAEYLDVTNSKREILLEIAYTPGSGHKLAVSPKGSYAYLVYAGVLTFFEIESKSKIGEIKSVASAVWIGDSRVVYSGSAGTFVYDVKNKEENKISQLGSVSDLSYNPKDEGVIAFTQEGSARVVACGTLQNKALKQEARIRALASERTAIMEAEFSAEGASPIHSVGYWRFKDADWNVRLSGEFPDFSVFATVWSRY